MGEQTAMQIAVVIPLFNGERWISRTLDSVIAQSLAPHEIILVDDGSEDGSREIASTFPDVTLWRNPLKGTHHARNFGLGKSTAEAVIFLDQDDIWHPRHLEILSALLQSHPGACAAVSASMTFASEAELHFE
ncbi:MAG: glycosyltransferase family A protein, partial [Cyanobacteriota bacterium]|nr:glycosyltransferase family A protein [Cyanobacteriota bacterium]